eukprot:37077_1
MSTTATLLFVFISLNFIHAIPYPNCATNITQFQICRIELSECTDESCNDFSNSQTYCPNITSCNSICVLHFQQSSNLCSYLSSQFKTHNTNSMSFIWCPANTINAINKSCKLTKQTPIPTENTIYVSTISNRNHDRTELVIRLDQNTLWTLIVLTIICLFGCIICCIARTFWKYHKRTAIMSHKPNNDISANNTDVNNNISKHNESPSHSITHASNHNPKHILQYPKYNYQSEPPPIIYKNNHKTSIQNENENKHYNTHYNQYDSQYDNQYGNQHDNQYDNQYLQRNSFPQKTKGKKKHLRKYSDHHRINNVTMIITNNNINQEGIEDEDTHMNVNVKPHIIYTSPNIIDDSLDSNDDIGPHIINDEESYMHSLTLAQVENAATNNNNIPDTNKKIQVHISSHISNPFHIESHSSKTNHLKTNEDTKSKNIIYPLEIDNDDSIKVQCTPRTPISNSINHSNTNTNTTAIIHVSKNTFDHSQTIDAKKEEINNTKNNSNISNILRKKLSEKLKHIDHESGISRSDLQEYFAILAASKHYKHHNKDELVSPTTMTHRTCKSSTDTETFYYKDNEKNVEHHILMPALDEKDSADYDKSTNTKNTVNTNEMNVVIDNTNEMNIKIDKNNKIIDKQLIHNDIDTNTVSVMSSTTPLEYTTSDEDVLHDKHSFHS